jgi:hypothetical protein
MIRFSFLLRIQRMRFSEGTGRLEHTTDAKGRLWLKRKSDGSCVYLAKGVQHLPHVLCFKAALRLEWGRQDAQDEAEQCKHRALTLGDSFS